MHPAERVTAKPAVPGHASMSASGAVASAVLRQKRRRCQQEHERRKEERSMHTPYYMPLSGQAIQNSYLPTTLRLAASHRFLAFAFS